MHTPDKPKITVAQAAKILGVNYVTVWEMIHWHELKNVEKRMGTCLLDEAEVLHLKETYAFVTTGRGQRHIPKGKITVKQAAEILNAGPQTIAEMIARKELKKVEKSRYRGVLLDKEERIDLKEEWHKYDQLIGKVNIQQAAQILGIS